MPKISRLEVIASGPRRAVRLRNVDATHRRGSIKSGRYVLLQESLKVGLQVPLVIALNLNFIPCFVEWRA